MMGDIRGKIVLPRCGLVVSRICSITASCHDTGLGRGARAEFRATFRVMIMVRVILGLGLGLGSGLEGNGASYDFSLHFL